ncbi:hypothetical protein ACI3ET_01245 [Ornithinimicrobium sp. LYQ121]|uniref:hypothetical protein n=1 Tax=Ornithinimicrobium sp. LYQ121 TaxID=3378801 RepID=UPI0038546A50
MDPKTPTPPDLWELKKWMPVLVPVEDYLSVAEFLAARLAERSGPGNGAGGVAGGDASTAVHPLLAAWPAWSEEPLRRLSESRSLTALRWARAMDAVAQGSQDWYTTTEVAKASGLTINEWRDAPRKISRHLKVHYTDVPLHEGHYTWPLRPWTNPDKPGEVSWGMAPASKERWLTIRELDR